MRVARSLREEHGFRGYIHLKSIPDADPELIAEAGRYADRLSINVELPTESGPEDASRRRSARRRSARTMARPARCASPRRKADRKAPRFSPAGQSTQMIVGADGANDADDPRDQRVALCELRPEAHLLLRVQPDPGCKPPAAARRPRRCARAPALSGRLAATASTASPPTRSPPAWPAACSISPSIRSSPGPCAIARASRSTSTRPRAKSCCAFRGSAQKTVDRIIVDAAGIIGLRLDDLARLAGSAAPRAAVHRHGRLIARAPSSTVVDLRARWRRRREQLSLFDESTMHRIDLDRSRTTFDEFRDAARALIGAGVPPADVIWRVGAQDDLFGGEAAAARHGARSACRRAYLPLAEAVDLPPRSGALRAALRAALAHHAWRARAARRSPSDPLVHRLQRDGEVGAARHAQDDRVRALPPASTDEGGERYVAWFEPEHHILRRVAAVLRRPLRRDALVDPHAARRAALGRRGADRSAPALPRSDAPPERRAGRLVAHLLPRDLQSGARQSRSACRPRCRRNTGATCPRPTLIPGLLAEAPTRAPRR